MEARPNTNSPRRGSSASAPTRTPEYPRRGQPIPDPEEEEFPRRGKPISEPTASDDLPPRRGRNPSQEPDNAGAVDYPKRGKPFREQVPPDDGGGDLPP